MSQAEKEVKSIFDAINNKGIDYDIEEEVEYKNGNDSKVDESGYKYVDNKGKFDKKEDKRNDKVDDRKREILKQVRKNKENSKKIRDDEVDDEDDETDVSTDREEAADKIKDNIEDEGNEEEEEKRKYKEEREEEIVNNVRVGGIELSDSDISRIDNIIKALGVPEEIMDSFNNENYEKVLDYLEEEHNVRFEREEDIDEKDDADDAADTSTDTEVKEEKEVDIDKDILEIKDGVEMAVMEDGFMTSYKEKWDKSLVIYEGKEEGVKLEYIDELDNNLAEFELVVEEENVRREVYIDKNEIEDVLE